MTMKELVMEFEFDCRVRELTPRTVRNYSKQLSYFLNFLEKEYKIVELDDVRPMHIKAFLGKFQLKGCKPSYINDLLKAVKCLFGYAYREKYTEELITKKVKNLNTKSPNCA